MFKINGESWRVLLVPPTHFGLRSRNGDFALGVCDDHEKTIFINGAVDEPLLQRILCHELTHAAMFSYNVELTLEQEELVADLIATYGQEIIAITNQIFRRLKEIKKQGTFI